MTQRFSQADNSVPTLTEVVEVWQSGPDPLEAQRSESAFMTESFRGRWAATTVAALASQVESVAPAAIPVDEDEVVQRVMLELQRQIDLMLEVRLREALMPLLARATDALVLEARNELALTLREVVEIAVSNSMVQQTTSHRKP